MSLRVESVSVDIGGASILSEVDLDLADHEVVAVLGPSGSGKTTLLRVIAGLASPSSGRVVVDGVDITGVPPHKRGIGLMFQDHALFPHRDVGGNVAFGLRMAHWSKSEIATRVAEVLDLVGLAGFDRREIDGLSGGERQRVALARALAPRPSVLLLDEPLGSLDRALRDRLLEDLAEVLRRSGASVVHVTHDQAEAFATGDRIVVMRDGEIAQVGPAEDVWRRPIDAGVARIVGPVALVRVSVEADGTVLAPWGPVVADPGGVTGAGELVVRPDTLAVADDGTDGIDGVVVGRTFRGDHLLARVAIEDSGDPPVEVSVADRAGAVPAVGERVGLVMVGRPVVVPPAS
ncbi:MAG: ABC transporter ATP-binding protein [Acidimicrobiales bacterium]